MGTDRCAFASAPRRRHAQAYAPAGSMAPIGSACGAQEPVGGATTYRTHSMHHIVRRTRPCDATGAHPSSGPSKQRHCGRDGACAQVAGELGWSLGPGQPFALLGSQPDDDDGWAHRGLVVARRGGPFATRL
jgi:hypothetical protein